MALSTLHDLLIAELKDLYDMEHQILKALPKMEKKATDETLKKGFHEHYAQTQMHVKRLEEAFKMLDEKPARKTCHGMKGLVKEGDEFLKMKSIDPAVRDAGLISAAQRVEHYEIAGYGCVIAFANLMGHYDVASLLEQTKNEEMATDQKLNVIAESSVNPAANKPDEKMGKMEKKKEKKSFVGSLLS